MSRHRFLMLGASIVGVGMLPFAQRSYAYAQDYVTPYNYASADVLADPKSHTEALRRMFSDERLKPPYLFKLPVRKPNPAIPGDYGGWRVTMGSGFATFPVKSKWTLTCAPPDPTEPGANSWLHRWGELVDGQRMFQNTDQINGNRDITFQNVYVDGHKKGLAAGTGIDDDFDFDQHFLDIDIINTFLRIGQYPTKQDRRWNYRVYFLDCTVKNWPGISCEFRQVNDFKVSGNTIESSHRGSLIFRIGQRNGFVENNVVKYGGDDGIAFNGNVGAYADWPDTGGAANVTLTNNYLGVKELDPAYQNVEGGQDIEELPGTRQNPGNSPLAIRHAAGPVYVNNTTVTQTENGYTEKVNGQDVYFPPQPAVEVRDRQGFTSRNVYIDVLVVEPGIDNKLVAPALSIPSPGVTGGIARGRVTEQYTGSSSPWQIAPPPDLFYRTDLDPPELTTSEETNLTFSEGLAPPRGL